LISDLKEGERRYKFIVELKTRRIKEIEQQNQKNKKYFNT